MSEHVNDSVGSIGSSWSWWLGQMERFFKDRGKRERGREGRTGADCRQNSRDGFMGLWYGLVDFFIFTGVQGKSDVVRQDPITL